jgi:hypothetical protein
LTGDGFGCDKIPSGGGVPMTKQIVFGVAVALATATLAAQAPNPATTAKKPATAAPKATQPEKTENRYVPAIMQDKMVTVAGCLKRDPDWQLADATVTGQTEKATYKLEGLSAARLSLFVGKRVEATGAFQDESKTANGKTLRRFEATAVQETKGSC